MADFEKNMIFSFGLCGHFALGTLSKTYLKDAVFEINFLANKINLPFKWLKAVNKKKKEAATKKIVVSNCINHELIIKIA